MKDERADMSEGRRAALGCAGLMGMFLLCGLGGLSAWIGAPLTLLMFGWAAAHGSGKLGPARSYALLPLALAVAAGLGTAGGVVRHTSEEREARARQRATIDASLESIRQGRLQAQAEADRAAALRAEAATLMPQAAAQLQAARTALAADEYQDVFVNTAAVASSLGPAGALVPPPAGVSDALAAAAELRATAVDFSAVAAAIASAEDASGPERGADVLAWAHQLAVLRENLRTVSPAARQHFGSGALDRILSDLDRLRSAHQREIDRAQRTVADAQARGEEEEHLRLARAGAPNWWMNVSACEVLRAYRANEIRALEQYPPGAHVLVSGRVDVVNRSMMGTMFVHARGCVGAMVRLADSQRAQAARLYRGDSFQADCTMGAFLGVGVNFDNCQLR